MLLTSWRRSNGVAWDEKILDGVICPKLESSRFLAVHIYNR